MTSIKAILLIAASLVSASAHAQKFYVDDPIRKELQIHTEHAPAAIELSDLYDRLGNTFHEYGTNETVEAANVNTIDEVPNSPWFTNRLGAKRMSIDELARGPNLGDGPDMTTPWSVVRGKSQGLTPGFEIVDGRGDRYVVKIDPVGVPELSSAAEVIATKIFYAVGYNVPENYIVRFDPESLDATEGATAEDRFGDKVRLTKQRLTRMLRHVPRYPDGTVRAVASKFVPGEPLGPFRYYGTRSDDPNDVVPHEHRRELRGLRLFAAWLNHDDVRAHNTQDVLVNESGQRFLRHYLIDFGSTFGSGTVDLQLPNLSFHYWLEPELIKNNALGLGFHVPAYRKVKWPHFEEFQSVGRWESTYFTPETWKPDYRNPAFARMTAVDAFWAAKILMRFQPDELSAIVAEGQYSDAEAAEYFVETLIERQIKTGRFGIVGINPLDGFAVVDGQLVFANLAEDYGFVDSSTTYHVSWFSYDNESDRIEGITTPMPTTARSASLPRNARPRHVASTTPIVPANDTLWVAEIRSEHRQYPAWNAPVRVFLRPRGEGYDVVGIERDAPAHREEER